jgi:hypothetical protein
MKPKTSGTMAATKIATIFMFANELKYPQKING